MMKKHLWSQKEILAIECEVKNLALTKAIRGGCLEWSTSAHEFAFSSVELFYHVVYSLDMLRSMACKEERMEYCSSLWNEMYDYISQHDGGDDEDMRNAASIVVVVVGQCLYAHRFLKYEDEILQLFTASEKGNKDAGQMILSLFRNMVDEGHNEELRTWLRDYMLGSACLSRRD